MQHTANAQRADLTQHAAALFKHLLTCCSEHKPSPDPVEKPDPALLFEIDDLSGKSRLADV